jgi:ankyrin repeat protein
MPKIDKIQKFLDRRSKYSQDPFKSAAQAGRKDVVERLIEQGIDVNKTDEYGETALHLAAKNGHTGLVQWMIEEKGAAVNQSDTNARTALHYAAEMGHKDILGLLLPKMTPDAINQADAYGKTALHLAAEKGHKDLVDLLVNQGAAVNQANNISGETALHYAAQMGHKDIVGYYYQK